MKFAFIQDFKITQENKLAFCIGGRHHGITYRLYRHGETYIPKGIIKPKLAPCRLALSWVNKRIQVICYVMVLIIFEVVKGIKKEKTTVPYRKAQSFTNEDITQRPSYYCPISWDSNRIRRLVS